MMTLILHVPIYSLVPFLSFVLFLYHAVVIYLISLRILEDIVYIGLVTSKTIISAILTFFFTFTQVIILATHCTKK